ncbi:N-acyl amino acid synthase FeeM domain-containing protein [Chitinimonas sp. PSY-7]|uniref:N-acyl amino acid synthase FeeM domain-containing protein n=1 Tax=Chitinimonas sp. PSY-7 TaxID=3459088 RepID=UPI00404018F1
MDSIFDLGATVYDTSTYQSASYHSGRAVRDTPLPKTTHELPWSFPSSGNTFIDEIALGSQQVALDDSPYRFAVAKETVSRACAATLVSQRYRWRGYGEACGKALLNPVQATQMTFIATQSGQLVGTVTSRLDGDTPMNCEALYPDIVDTKRAQGHRLAEFGQLAINNSSKPLEIMGPLLHLTVIFTHQRNAATHALIEVNPRHVAFYRRAFGFTVIGEQRHCLRVDAPAVLMQLDLKKVQEQISEQGGRRSGRISVFPYCFSLAESKVIEQTLLGSL